MRRWIRRAALGFGAVAAVTVYQSTTQLRLFAFGQPGSGFVPLVLGLCLGGLALGLGLSHRGPDSATVPFLEKQAAWRLGLGVTLIALAGAFFEVLGAVASVGFLVMGWLWVLERKPVLTAAAFGGLLALLSWLVFQVGLEVQLPHGFWSQ